MKRILSVILTVFLLLGLCVPAFAASSDPQQAADHLHSLGLFQGTRTGVDGKPVYELDRAPYRDEAVTMLVRLLGKEAEANSRTWTTPFDDVDDWAKPYVGYAYANGLTNGVGATKFGSKSTATATMYITFVLRALGYTDGVDFTWDAAWVVSDMLGITDGRYNAETNASFTRGGVAVISDNALEAKYKGSSDTLLDKLIADGAVTAGQPAPAPAPVGERTVLTSEQIYARCMPAVLYIEVYDEYGDAIATGSGFFIDADGTAVTNHHVIYGATSAKVWLANSSGADQEERDVLGVYDWSEEEDWAVLKISGSNDSYLKAGDPSTAAGGATVYALGSPLGLSASISDGIVSNPARVFDGQTYIQITAPISPGSSGGALVNKYGDVVGITSAGFEEGQNLNLAIPIARIANAKHGELTPINQTYVIPHGVIYPAERFVTLKPGETFDNVISATKSDTDELLTVYYEIDDTNIVGCKWDGWAPEDTEVTLHMTAGSNFGSTIVYIYLYTSDSEELLDYDWINVTVVGGEVVPEAEDLTLDVGASQTMQINAKSFDGRNVSIRFEIEDKSIVSCAWGTWPTQNDPVPLTFTALACGVTSVEILLLDKNTEAVLATAYIYVQVVGGKLTVSEAELVMAPGETKTVTITGTPNDPTVRASIYADEFDSTVIDWQRGALGAGPVQLTITALSEGWDCIYITLEDSDGTVLVDGWIDVYVTMDGREPATPLQLENGAMKAEMGEVVSADPDGNGTADEVSVWIEPDEYGWDRVCLSINGTDYTAAMYELADGFDCPDNAFWAITDLDASDGLLEIAIQDWGPSDDLTTTFFRFNGSRLFSLGSVEGFLYFTNSPGNISILGGGKLSSYMRLSVLQTWYGTVQYALGTDARMAVVPQDFYTSTYENQQTTLLRAVYAYNAPTPYGTSRVLAAGTTAQIVGTDNVQWVKLRLADGSECWLQMVGYGYELETPDGLVYVSEALSDLLMAD